METGSVTKQPTCTGIYTLRRLVYTNKAGVKARLQKTQHSGLTKINGTQN